jgi:imidazolonepropionase-like amidohydrolase
VQDAGCIAEGVRADLVARGGDPTEDISAMRRVRMTMVSGRVLYEKLSS